VTHSVIRPIKFSYFEAFANAKIVQELKDRHQEEDKAAADAIGNVSDSELKEAENQA
jgi:hypothetical protein